MTYTAIDTFYPPAERLHDSPSRRDGVDEPAEAALRAHGCQLVQEAGILLRLYPPLNPSIRTVPILFPSPSFSSSLRFRRIAARKPPISVSVAPFDSPPRPQVAMNTAQVLLHRFYCKQSLARFSVKVRLSFPQIPSDFIGELHIIMF